MGRILRSLVAGGIGTLLGWIALPLCLVCSASALGLVETAGSPFDTHHGAARHAAVWVLVGLGAGVVGRIAHVLRERRSVDKPVPPPWISRWAFSQFALAIVGLLGSLVGWGAGLGRLAWLQDLAAFCAWLAVWSGAVICVALAIAAGKSLRGPGGDQPRRAPTVLALAGCLSVLFVPQLRSIAEGELEPYDELVASIRKSAASPASPSEGGFGTLGVVPSRPGEECADSFLRPYGSRRATWTRNERLAKRRARYPVDVDQLLLDAVVLTCGAERENPAPYFTAVVKNALFHGVPDGEVCALDPELPAETIDPDLYVRSRICWSLVQKEACDKGAVMESILYLRAAGSTYPEIAQTLQLGESAVKMKFQRFIDDLPAPVRLQCR